MEQAWADTSKDTQKLMYDMRACFDNSWSMNEAGVTHLADMTEQTIGGAYDEITSDAANTFGNGGSLPTETDNAWANVEPGAKDVNTNLTWMMDQSYNAIKAGCEAALHRLKTIWRPQAMHLKLLVRRLLTLLPQLVKQVRKHNRAHSRIPVQARA